MLKGYNSFTQQMYSAHRIREGEPGLPILPCIMAPSAMEQKLGRFGSLPNTARKLIEQLYALPGILGCVHIARFILAKSHTQSATSERLATKTRINPIFCPWLIK